MTQKEFEQRVGFEVSAETYHEIELMYMSCGDMDKDKFCRDWKKHHESEIIAEFFRVNKLNDEVITNQKDAINHAAELLIGKAHAYGDADFRNEAVRLVGERKVVMITIKLDLPLWEEDKEYLLTNI